MKEANGSESAASQRASNAYGEYCHCLQPELTGTASFRVVQQHRPAEGIIQPSDCGSHPTVSRYRNHQNL